MIKLSILVPTVPSRIDTFYPRLIKELLNQIGSRKDIEILALFDNKKRTVGEKRQDLLCLAHGDYVVFIDDDDRISKDYISDIINTIENNPSVDCIVFNSICSIEGGYGKLCKYGIEFEYGDILDGKEWRGKPAHTMVYISSIAKKHSYISSNFGEDIEWVKRACQDIKTQVRIDKVLYYYDCKPNTTSETRNIPDIIINENIQKITINDL
jgi:glycosyltransferase involved in cell wall biosynthesis